MSENDDHGQVDRVKAAVNELNSAIRSLPSDIIVQLDTIESRTLADRGPRPIIQLQLSRAL